MLPPHMRFSLLLGPVFVVAIACGGSTSTGIADGGIVGNDAAAAPDAPASKVDAGDRAAPTQVIEGIYFGACLSKLAGRVDRVLRFYTEVKYTPLVPDEKATLQLKLTSLQLGPNNGPPPTVSKSATTGQTYTSTSSVKPNGVYDAPLGTIKIPGEANPISGRDIDVEQAAVPGKFGLAKFCSQLSGHVVQPTDILLEGDSNTCIYLPVKEGDPTPTIQLTDFPDTCALN